MCFSCVGLHWSCNTRANLTSLAMRCVRVSRLFSISKTADESRMVKVLDISYWKTYCDSKRIKLLINILKLFNTADFNVFMRTLGGHKWLISCPPASFCSGISHKMHGFGQCLINWYLAYKGGVSEVIDI